MRLEISFPGHAGDQTDQRVHETLNKYKVTVLNQGTFLGDNHPTRDISALVNKKHVEDCKKELRSLGVTLLGDAQGGANGK